MDSQQCGIQKDATCRVDSICCFNNSASAVLYSYVFVCDHCIILSESLKYLQK